MTPFAENATAVGVLIGVATTAVIQLVTMIIQIRDGRVNRQNAAVGLNKMSEVAHNTNAISARNEAIAEKLGIEKGKKQERENPGG